VLSAIYLPIDGNKNPNFISFALFFSFYVILFLFDLIWKDSEAMNTFVDENRERMKVDYNYGRFKKN